MPSDVKKSNIYHASGMFIASIVLVGNSVDLVFMCESLSVSLCMTRLLTISSCFEKR